MEDTQNPCLDRMFRIQPRMSTMMTLETARVVKLLIARFVLHCHHACTILDRMCARAHEHHVCGGHVLFLIGRRSRCIRVLSMICVR